MDYPFESILINDRDERISDITNGKAEPKNDFEESTFRFIREWLGGKQEFELHTSGSTGTPKRIVITRDQMESSARATQAALDLQRFEEAMICVDTRYIAGQMMLVRSFVTGMHICAVTPSANPLGQYPEKRIDFIALVPYQVSAILKSGKPSALNSIHKVIIGGAAMSEEIIEALQNFACKAFATYGMTETISHIALRALNGAGKSPHYKTLPGIRISVDDRSCLMIKCPYLGHEITTNDIVDILNPTTFRWIGRADNVINTGGVKVSPEELEGRMGPLIRSLNLHDRFIISSKSDIALGEKVVLVLESQSLDSEQKTVLTSCLKESLPKYEVPKEVITLRPFPETGPGKIDRLQIIKMISKRP